MRRVFSGILVLLVLSSTGWSRVVRISLRDEVDKDIVYEADEGRSASTFGENLVAHEAFVEEGYYDGQVMADGLPKNRRVASTRPRLGEYVLRPYNGKNVIELASHQAVPHESHTINVPNGRYWLIGLLVASVDGDTSFTIKLNYVDGTETVFWWEADDWYKQGAREAVEVTLSGMDRVNKDTGVIDDANHYHLYETFVTPDGARILDYIIVGTDPHRYPVGEARWGAVFAINGDAETVAPARKARRKSPEGKQ